MTTGGTTSDNEWYNEWLRMKTSDNEWLVTKNDNAWQLMTASGKTNEKEASTQVFSCEYCEI